MGNMERSWQKIVITSSLLILIVVLWVASASADRSVPLSNDKGTFTNKQGMKFVYIEPGSFMMGSPSSEPKRLKNEVYHRVTLTQGFYIQTTEVTQGQWYGVMGTKPWSGQMSVKEGRNHAASYVLWSETQEFINKLNSKVRTGKYRLPTEAQWEYACRAGSDTAYSFGNSSFDLESYAWYEKNSMGIGGEYAHGVGLKKPNHWGLYDMHGNVLEWCQGWYGKYSSGPVTDPQGDSSGSQRVLRGGDWLSATWHCRSAKRFSFEPNFRCYNIGFRLVFCPGQ